MSETLSLDQIDFDRTYTLEEFLEIAYPNGEEREDGIKYELIEGKILATPRIGASFKHSLIATNLATQLDLFAGRLAGDKQLGTVCVEGPIKLTPEDPNTNWLEPDVLFVLDSRMPVIGEGPLPIVPDIVAEVWSPSDDTRKIKNKIEGYQQARVPLIWSIYMENNYILVYTLDNPDIKILNLKDFLEGDPILPGFRVSVEALLK